MSSKAGYLKEQKSLNMENIGKFLETTGTTVSNFLGDPGVQNAAGIAGKIAGSLMIPIPVVGGTIGKYAAKGALNNASYAAGFVGEAGKSIQRLENGSSTLGQELQNLATYVPNRIVNDTKDAIVNSNLVQVITGKKTIPDTIIGSLEESALVNWLAPDKTHAWKDAQGNYHKEWQPGTTMVVGTWHEGSSSNQPRPDPSSNNIKIGKGGEVIRNGF